ncbi:hypothetical protein ERO13_D06G041750v2 [Gossypium hirsutum]|nr:hypothetical protein ERO13_D06G041750v2 [Gossypium hirsutum]KAG4140834.1 hypothetical protein ERO13_D06G041750v2 [Gossypium hirsutum]KAG4140835.1 hypothetical protein ERO13_D06G041750v2 [Gossypium hirsutum]KAG4140836.1 hypothetical protein ERO13_D06G041750v2 [Gossypium hirsutum]
MLAASVTAPLRPSLSTGHRLESRIECSSRCGLVRIPTRISHGNLACNHNLV